MDPAGTRGSGGGPGSDRTTGSDGATGSGGGPGPAGGNGPEGGGDGGPGEGGSNEEAALKSDVGLFDAVAIEVGLIVGAGLFALTGVAVDLAGPAAFVSYLLSFAVVSLGIVPTATLAMAFPTVAGNYRYPRDLWSPHVAFLSAWGLTISMFGGGLPLYALSFGDYVRELVAVDPRLSGFLLLTVFFVVNVAGIRPAAKLQAALFLSLLASLLAFVVVGAPRVEAANFSPLFGAGVGGVVTAAAVLYFVCLGANFVVDLGGEVRDAAVTIPKSLAVSIPLTAALYALTAFVGVGTVGAEALAGENLAVPARAVLPPALSTFFVVGGAMFAITSTANAVFMIAPKYLLALSGDGVLPEALGAVNDRFGTPHRALTAVYGLTVASILVPLPFEELGSLLGLGGVFLVAPVMVAAARFARDRPDRVAALPVPLSPRALVAVCALGVVCNAALFVLLAANTPWVFGVWAAGMVLGEGYYRLRRRQLRRAGRGFRRTGRVGGPGATGGDPADD